MIRVTVTWSTQFNRAHRITQEISFSWIKDSNDEIIDFGDDFTSKLIDLDRCMKAI